MGESGFGEENTGFKGDGGDGTRAFVSWRVETEMVTGAKCRQGNLDIVPFVGADRKADRFGFGGTGSITEVEDLAETSLIGFEANMQPERRCGVVAPRSDTIGIAA